MKSETLVKIKENRKKYFLETLKVNTEENSLLNPQNSQDQKEQKEVYNFYKAIAPQLRTLAIGFSRIRVPGTKIIYYGKCTMAFFHNIHNEISNQIMKRTEKHRERLFAFLLVIFDS